MSDAKRMKTGIVILNYNDSETTINLVRHIEGFSSLSKIVVVDNASTDDSYDRLQNQSEKYGFDLIGTSRNGGYASGNNVGARYLIEKCQCEIVVIANPDILFEEELLISIVDNFMRHPDYALLSGVMCDPQGNIDRAPYRNLNSYTYDLADCFAIGRHLHKKKKYPAAIGSGIFPVEVIQGSFWAIRSDVLKEIDYLDEGTFLYYEEMILGHKLKSYGYKSGLVGVPFYHYHAVSITKSIKKVNAWKIHLKSKCYYERNYNCVKGIKYFILKLFCFLSIIEKYILAFIQDARS